MKFNKRYNCYVTKNALVYRYDEKRDRLKEISQSKCKQNAKYLRVSLVDSFDNVRRSIKVHRLVYMTFIGDIPQGYQIDHIDGDASNNNLENLRCVTPKENSNNPNTVWKLKGIRNPMFGRHHTEESKRKMSETLKSNNRAKKGVPKGNSRWAKYGMSRCAIETKLKLSRREVEMLDKENKLMEVLHD